MQVVTGVAGFLKVKYVRLNIGAVKPLQGTSRKVPDIRSYDSWWFLSPLSMIELSFKSIKKTKLNSLV
jgi:hypothetical protein